MSKEIPDSSAPIRILCVDDHPLIRRGVTDLIANESDLCLIAEAASGREAIEKHRVHLPDITLMDLQMPDIDGIDATIAIRSEQPSAKIIMLTTYDGDVRAHRALKAGAQAYVLKSLIRTDLLEIVRAVYRGHKHVATDIAAQMAHHVSDDMLSIREIQVLELIALGNSNRVIGTQLFINEETVKGHVKRILSKLEAKDRTHAVTIGLKRGILRI
jgi:DNA-binding NarL/FixJ family response regulator